MAVSAEGGAPAGVEGFPEKLSAGMRGAEGGTAAAGTEVVTLENDDDKIMEVTLRVYVPRWQLLLDIVSKVSSLHCAISLNHVALPS